MASNGYVVFAVRAYTRYRRDDARPMDDLDGRGGDLLAAMTDVGRQLAGRSKPEQESRFEQAYRVDAVKPRGCALLLDGAVGPYGTAGRLIDVDNGTALQYTDRQATMTDLRSFVVRPPGATVALLFCERRGARHMKNAIERGFLRWVGRHYGVTFDMQSHVDYRAWSHYLENAVAATVTAVWRSTRREDYRPDTSRMPELHMSATGVLAERFGRSFREALQGLAHAGRPRDARRPAINITELTPRNADDYQRERWELDVEDNGVRKKIVIEREQLPQWVYEFDSQRRLTGAAMRSVWVEHAPELLSAYGATLPEGWSSTPTHGAGYGQLGVVIG